MEGHLLILRLTRQLLGRAFPKGSRTVGKRSTINLHDERQSFLGGDYHMDVLAPWSLAGWAESVDGRQVNFAMRLAYGTAPPGQAKASERRTMHLPGQWLVDGRVLPIGDGMSLVGWKVVPRGDPKTRFKTGRVGAYATIGQLRNALVTP